MNFTASLTFAVALTSLVVSLPSASGAKKNAAQATLTATGKELEANYTQQMETLKKELTRALPSVNSQKKTNLTAAREAESAAIKQIEEARKRMG